MNQWIRKEKWKAMNERGEWTRAPGEMHLECSKVSLLSLNIIFLEFVIYSKYNAFKCTDAL